MLKFILIIYIEYLIFQKINNERRLQIILASFIWFSFFHAHKERFTPEVMARIKLTVFINKRACENKYNWFTCILKQIWKLLSELWQLRLPNLISGSNNQFNYLCKQKLAWHFNMSAIQQTCIIWSTRYDYVKSLSWWGKPWVFEIYW